MKHIDLDEKQKVLTETNTNHSQAIKDYYLTSEPQNVSYQTTV